MLLHSIHRPRVLRGPRIEAPLRDAHLATPRLVLRPYRLDDADDWYSLQRVQEVNHYLHWPERSRHESFQHLRDRTHHTTLKQADDFLALAVERDGHVIGDVSLRLKVVPADSRSVEIAWILHPEHAGHGYATEAASAMIDLAFERLDARWITAHIDNSNHKSIAVAERLGMRGIPVDDEITAYFSSPALRSAGARRS